jgi:hypothetical protein
VTDEERQLDEFARKAYEAYGKVTGYKNYEGNPMPAFDDLGETIQDAWRAAAQAACDAQEAAYSEALANSLDWFQEPGA